MHPTGLNELRESYLRFFEERGHVRQPSFSLIPQGDSSLLLINSGMAPLKPYFSGEAEPPGKRMTSCQKCVRVIDIDRVGKTDRHCTFFEMLGHFSFGDYFKREAILWTWEFFTKTVGIDPERLHCSVYLDDDEAWDIWVNEVGVDPSHMVRLGKEDNFWDIGSGPCGPCSEIYYDRGAQFGCGKPDCKAGCDCDRFVEVGNNVFTQFNNDGKGNYSPLAQKNIDFGMGLERLACVVQGVESVFEVDSITRIRRHASKLAGTTYGENAKADMSLRVITDHIRSSVMLICDGVRPSNEGRGYVLRRLLRRAARHGRLLGVEKPFLCELAETVVAESGGAYPELIAKREHIRTVITAEEERFAQTLDSGLRLLRAELEKLEGGVLPGETAFKLYDTFGFPIDLTLEILEEQGVSLDRDGFDALMKEQRERARAARASLGAQGWVKPDLPKNLRSVFVGYTETACDAALPVILADGERADTAREGQNVTLVLDKSPFYAESGGQCADQGRIEAPTGVMIVRDVRKSADGAIMHIGEMESGELGEGQKVHAEIDCSRREAIARAHSATHLLQKALREVLGTHVEQAGSQVEPDRLRFDFCHNAALGAEELARIQSLVNDYILAALPVSAEEMPLEEAKRLGAMALFGEKYGDTVRVVRMGEVSMELCGGTHLTNTAMAGLFVLLSESSVAAGTRRVEALTGKAAFAHLQACADTVAELSGLLKTPAPELGARIGTLLDEHKQLQRSLEQQKQREAKTQALSALKLARDIAGLRVLTWVLEDADANHLRVIGDILREKEPGVVALLCLSGEKLTFLASCGKEAVRRGVKAGSLIASVTKICGGSGGGRPDSAMGGGKDPSKLVEALASVDALVLELVK